MAKTLDLCLLCCPVNITPRRSAQLSSVPASMGCLLKDNGVDRPRSSVFGRAKKYGRVAKHQMAINIPSCQPPPLSPRLGHPLPFNRLYESCSCIQSCIHLFSHSFALHIRVLGRVLLSVRRP